MKDKFENKTNTVASKYQVDLTMDQIDFLLFAIGYMRGAASTVDPFTQILIENNAASIMPKLAGAKH